LIYDNPVLRLTGIELRNGVIACQRVDFEGLSIIIKI
jgi:hypothetical protein